MLLPTAFILLLRLTTADLILGDMGYGNHDGMAGPELVDLAGQNLSCSLPPAHPNPVVLAMSLSTEDEVMVCGGMNSTDTLSLAVNDCYAFVDNEWVDEKNMNHARHSAASVYFPTGGWWVGGGVDKGKVLNSTETLILADGIWNDGAALPYPLWSHCAAKVGDRKVLVTGGMTTVEDSSALGQLNNKTFIFDIYSGQVEEVGSLQHPRAGGACTTLSDGSIIIAGGMVGFGNIEDSVEVFDLNTKSWKMGSPLPIALTYGNFLNVETFTGPVLVGGFAGPGE